MDEMLFAGECMNRIAFIAANESAPWGGSEELWGRTAIFLASQNTHVYVSVRDWPEIPRELAEILKVCAGVQYRKDRSSALSRLFEKAEWKKPKFTWLDAVKPDLVMISQSVNAEGFDWMQACRERGMPYAVIVPAAGEAFWPSGDLFDRGAAGFAAAKKIYFVADANRILTEMQFVTSLPQAKIVRFPYKVSYDARPGWPAAGPLRLACMARIDPISKGQDLLFNVLAMDKWRERELRVTLFRTGRCVETFTRNIERMRLKHVDLLDFVDDVESVWASHHGLILPSRFEGLPLALVEAMLCRRMAIVTDVADNAKVVNNGVTGFVAEAPTVTHLDRAMERAWQDRARWCQMGEEASRRIRTMVPPNPVEIFADELKSLLE